MIENFISTLTETNSAVNIFDISVTIAAAFVLALLVYFTHRFTTDEYQYDKNFGLVLLLVPVVVAAILAVVGTNVARAFSIAGVLAIVRYRSVNTKPRDLVFIFFGVAVGFMAGVNLYLGALIFVLLSCVAVVVYSVLTSEKTKNVKKTLKIAVPESIDYAGLFNPVLDKYTNGSKLVSVSIISGGTVTELCYAIKLKDEKDTKAFLDELRTLNANFKISLKEFVIED